MQKVVGIIGGMGPSATVDLMNKIITHTPATRDQDHIHIIVDNYAQIPDRTNAILGEGTSPAPFIIESAKRLQNAGAELLAMACNTAHFYYDVVQESVQIPILHMPLETAQYLHKHHFTKIGLLATDGTLKTQLYKKSCEQYGIEVMEPDTEMQKHVMQGIYAIKGGDFEKGLFSLSTVATGLREEGAEAIIGGCTEVPLVLHNIIDPTEVLAKKVIEMAKEIQFV
jgi:aspartate racemase